jgi:RNA polymerase sigma factor (sigma-70 family)
MDQFAPSPEPDTAASLRTRQSLLARLGDWKDAKGWQEFFDQYWMLVFGFIRKAGLSGVEAEEVAQEVFISVAGEMPDFRYDRARGAFKSWLLTIVRRRLVDFWRQTGRRIHGLSLEALTEFDPGAEPAHEAELEGLWQTEWDRHLLEQACLRVRCRVSARHYCLFEMIVRHGRPLAEAARAAGMSATLAYVTKHRVGRLLKKEVARLRECEDGPPC